jgi:hypothetical protein
VIDEEPLGPDCRDLFGVGLRAVSKHVKSIFESGELEPIAAISLRNRVGSEADLSKERRKP